MLDTNSGTANRHGWWHSVVLPLLLLSGCLACVGGFAYFSARQAITRDVGGNIESVARSKVEQIEQWLDERRDQSQLIITDQFVLDLHAWLNGGMRNDQLRERLIGQLRFPNSAHHRSISLHSASDGSILLTPIARTEHPLDRELALRVARTGQIALDDIHVAARETPSGIAVGYFVPVLDKDGKTPLAVLHLALDPDEVLYPLLQRWPGASATAETLLIRKEGDEIVYLNTLRDVAASPLTVRQPISADRLFGAHVINQSAGFVEGWDYRGVASVAYGLPVAGTPWFMVAKMNDEEVYAQVNAVAVTSAIVLGTFLLLCAWWLIWRRRVIEEMEASLREIEDLYQNAPCGYHSLDEDGVFVRINDTELNLLGYRREEVVGRMKFDALLALECLAQFRDNFSQFLASGKVTELQYTLIRKDGSPIPVRLSATAIRDGKGRFLMSRGVIIDISEQKRAEEVQRRHHRALKLLSDCSMAIACSEQEQALLDSICRLIVTTADYRMAWIGIPENDPAKTIRPVSSYGHEAGYLDRMRISWESQALGQGPTGVAVRERRTQVNQDFLNNPQVMLWRDAAIARGYHASIALPLINADEVLGVLTIYAPVPNAFAEDEVALLQDLASNVATGMAALRARAAHQQAIQSQQESEERLRGLFSSILDAVFVLARDPDGKPGRFVDVNDVACTRLGYSRAELLTMSPLDIVAPDSREDVRGMLGQLVNQRSALFERNHVAKDGRRIPVEISATTFEMHGQQMVVAVARDISERKEAEAKLRLLWRAVESSFNGFIITGALDKATANYPILYVNPAFEQMTGYTAAEVMGRSPVFLQDDDRDQAGVAILNQALREQRECRVVLRNYRKDGSMFWNEMLVAPVRNDEGRATHYIGILSDVTERRSSERQRIESAEQLQKLSAHLQSAREDERAHIARELHDELGQILTAVKMDISFLRNHYPSAPEIAEKLKDMTELVDATLASVRRISSDLRPIILDDLGLKAAIEWLAHDFERRYPGISCQLALELDKHRVTGDVAIASYRIVQECITNVARHAQATKIHIMVAVRDDRRLVISVQDNGQGLGSPPNNKGFGLLGMKERVLALGGRFNLESIPGEGVSVDVSIPLPEAASGS